MSHETYLMSQMDHLFFNVIVACVPAAIAATMIREVRKKISNSAATRIVHSRVADDIVPLSVGSIRCLSHHLLEESRAVDLATLFATRHEVSNLVMWHVLGFHVAWIRSAIDDIVNFTIVQCLKRAGVARIAFDVLEEFLHLLLHDFDR